MSSRIINNERGGGAAKRSARKPPAPVVRELPAVLLKADDLDPVAHVAHVPQRRVAHQRLAHGRLRAAARVWAQSAAAALPVATTAVVKAQLGALAGARGIARDAATPAAQRRDAAALRAAWRARPSVAAATARRVRLRHAPVPAVLAVVKVIPGVRVVAVVGALCVRVIDSRGGSAWPAPQ
eukprot:156905-Chlamydomonas_euryale.AAC.1